MRTSQEYRDSISDSGVGVGGRGEAVVARVGLVEVVVLDWDEAVAVAAAAAEDPRAVAAPHPEPDLVEITHEAYAELGALFHSDVLTENSLHQLFRQTPGQLLIVGKRFADATVLRLAHAYEQATPWRGRRPN